MFGIQVVTKELKNFFFSILNEDLKAGYVINFFNVRGCHERIVQNSPQTAELC